MASFLRKSSLFSHLRFNQESIPNGFAQPNRGYHIDHGAREKALLEEDPALSRFKSYKKGVKRIKRIGDVLTIVVVAGCCYEIYVRATMQEEATKQEAKSAN